MIESGLRTWALTNAAITALLGQSQQDLANKCYSAFYFSFLPKQPGGVLPAILLDKLSGTEEADTLDPRSAGPSLQKAVFQFGSVAQDGNQNPGEYDGYLSAVLLSRALEEQLLGLATGNRPLPDGTTLHDLWIHDEFDAHFEIGAQGYLYRRVLKVGMIYLETS